MEMFELKKQSQLSRTTANCKPGNKQLINFVDNRLLKTSQMARKETAITPMKGSPVPIKIKGKSYNICEHGSVTVPANQRPKYGSGTSGDAAWKDILMDQGNDLSATRLHVVNAKFGGVGENNGGNLHPGSKSLNQHHKVQENTFKSLLNDSSKDSIPLKYDCRFSGMPRTINAGDTINDPTITVTISENGVSQTPQTVITGDGMKCC